MEEEPFRCEVLMCSEIAVLAAQHLSMLRKGLSQAHGQLGP